jgi:hypothetical protein
LPLALVARNERIKLGLQRDIERDQLKQGGASKRPTGSTA